MFKDKSLSFKLINILYAWGQFDLSNLNVQKMVEVKIATPEFLGLLVDLNSTLNKAHRIWTKVFVHTSYFRVWAIGF